MSTPVTVISSFGRAVSTAEGLIRLELDDELNVGPGAVGEDQQAKTQFSPGEEIFFLIHHDPGLRIESVKSTSGTVVTLGWESRERTADLLFTTEEPSVELDYFPASGGIEVSWWGHTAKLSRDKRTVTASVDNGEGEFPAYGRVSYTARFLSCKLVAPAVELAFDEEYPVQIVVRYTKK